MYRQKFAKDVRCIALKEESFNKMKSSALIYIFIIICFHQPFISYKFYINFNVFPKSYRI